MANIIALIWDCDKTIIDGYMQDPIFEEYGIDADDFWKEVNEIPKRYAKMGIRVNNDTYYLNHFIKNARDGIFDGLNNEKLKEFGKKQKFYPGILDFLRTTKDMFRDDPSYSEYGIRVEHYIVSTGFAELIRGSDLMNFIDGLWGCELLDAPLAGKADKTVINEVVFTIDNTTKTRAIFEINKGIGKIDGIEVNTSIAKELRRVRFENMIYIADGPSDIPAFSVVNSYGGSTFAIYPKGDMEAMKQVDQMRKDGRVDMYAEADYSENTTTNMWIQNRIYEIADRIRDEEKKKIVESASGVPQHLHKNKQY